MQLIDKVTFGNNHLLNNISSSFYSRLDAWLINHSFLHWLVNHPLISLIISLMFIVLMVRLLLTIYRSVAAVIDRMWLWILRSPFLLLKFLFGWEVKSKDNSVNTTVTNYEITNNPEKLEEIMSRLEHIQQQQQQIVRDIAFLKQQCKPIEVIPKELPSIIKN
jgi:hypothetical protein